MCRYRCIPHGAERFPFTLNIIVIHHLTDQHLPVVHTCGFTLELPLVSRCQLHIDACSPSPQYSSFEVLCGRVEAAMRHEAGFHIA